MSVTVIAFVPRTALSATPLAALFAGTLNALAPNASLAADAGEGVDNAPVVLTERALFERLQDIPRLIARKQLSVSAIPNPHWRVDACGACHAGTPVRGSTRLRDRDINRLCNSCHEAVSPHSYIHTVGSVPPKEMRARMAKGFQQAIDRGGGVVSCIACHDLPLQCLPANSSKRGLNPLFFRDGPFRSRTDLCYRCHDLKAYERLNPHDQIGANGKLREDRCLVCHEHVPRPTENAADTDFNVQGDLTVLCTGCHPSFPHPGGQFAVSRKGKLPNHLVTPSATVERRMRQQMREQRFVLPLDPNTGRIFCGTCHNPHASGAFKGITASGAGARKRLRTQQLCGMCHDK
jgi:hypothetical protein